jgi:hypothetical protein
VFFFIFSDLSKSKINFIFEQNEEERGHFMYYLNNIKDMKLKSKKNVTRKPLLQGKSFDLKVFQVFP